MKQNVIRTFKNKCVYFDSKMQFAEKAIYEVLRRVIKAVN